MDEYRIKDRKNGLRKKKPGKRHHPGQGKPEQKKREKKDLLLIRRQAEEKRRKRRNLFHNYTRCRNYRVLLFGIPAVPDFLRISQRRSGVR